MKQAKICEKCGSGDSHIYDTRVKDGYVIRRRMCMKCGKKWMTIEVDYYSAMEGKNDTEK